MERRSKKSKKSKKAKSDQAAPSVFIEDVLEPSSPVNIEKVSEPPNKTEVDNITAIEQLPVILERLSGLEKKLTQDSFNAVKLAFLTIFNDFFPIAERLKNDPGIEQNIQDCFIKLHIIRYRLRLIQHEDEILESLNLPSDSDHRYDYSNQQPIIFKIDNESDPQQDNFKKTKVIGRSSGRIITKSNSKSSADTAPTAHQAFFSPTQSKKHNSGDQESNPIRKHSSRDQQPDPVEEKRHSLEKK